MEQKKLSKKSKNTGRTWFKKGHTPWNKGLKGWCIPWNKGKTMEIKEGENYKIKDWLQGEYWDKGLSTCKIAKIYGVDRQTIRYYMKKFNIPRRKQLDTAKNDTKYSIDESMFERCDTPEKAYWLGFIMADGYVQSKYRKLEIELQARDRKHLEKFRKFLSSDVPIRNRWKTTSFGTHESTIISINRKKIIEDLKNYGIIPRKTGKEQIKNIPDEYYSDFIRGYFDGDGCLGINWHKNKKRHSLRFCLACASRQFLENIQNILIKSCNLSKPKIYRTGLRCYSLVYSGSIPVLRIFDFLLQNSKIGLERKYKVLMEI